MRPSHWKLFPLAIIAGLGVVVLVNVGMVYAALHSFPGKAGDEDFALSNRYDAVLDREGEFVRTVCLGGDEAGEVAARVRVRTRRAERGIQDPLRVVATEAESLDRVVRHRAARAAEAPVGVGGKAAVEAGVEAGDCGRVRFSSFPPARGRGVVVEPHRTITRRVAAKS